MRKKWASARLRFIMRLPEIKVSVKNCVKRFKVWQVRWAIRFCQNENRKQERQQGEASYTVGVLIAENYLAQYETFYWKMLQELAVAATEKRCVAAVEILRKEDERNTLKLPACVKGNKVDGLIVLGKINKEYIVKLTETARIPVVFLDYYDKDFAKDAVVTDNFYGTYLLTEFMFEQGIEELGFVGSIYSTSSIMDRYCGFLKP